VQEDRASWRPQQRHQHLVDVGVRAEPTEGRERFDELPRELVDRAELSDRRPAAASMSSAVMRPARVA
jgi:hypothetical protein